MRSCKAVKKLLHRELAFAEDDEVRACLEIFLRVCAGLRTADDSLPARFARDLHDLDHVAARHQIGIDAEDGWRLRPKVVEERLAVGERGVEDIDIKALLRRCEQRYRMPSGA